mgnify:CR=1 FL=1
MNAAGLVRLPATGLDPVRSIIRRVLAALGVLAVVVFVVWIDRDGYRDTSDGSVDLLDAIYYSTVSLSTTGYGDITPMAMSSKAYAARPRFPRPISISVTGTGYAARPRPR